MDFFCGQALADSTRKTYAVAKKRYVRFCTTHHINILPSTERNLCHYVAILAKEGVRATSIKCYLSAVRHLHIEEGWGTPNMADMLKLELVIRGIKRAQGKTGHARPRQPITLKLLEKLRTTWQGKGWNGRMLWAAASLCFFGFLRSGEITIPTDSAYDSSTHVSFTDVAVDNLASPTMLKLHLKASKTDPLY